MSSLDWLVLIITNVVIIGYGVWKSRGQKNIQGYLLANNDLKWFTIGTMSCRLKVVN